MTDQPTPAAKKVLIRDEDAFLLVLKRLKEANDNVAYRTSGGLRIMIRNEPIVEDGHEKDITFDISVVVDEESPAILKAIKNEIDIMEDDSGCIVIEEFSFPPDDTDTLKHVVEFLNAVELWTVCQCGEYLIKDACVMCYYCQMTGDPQEDAEDVFCPICHESGRKRWMTTTACCSQRMHTKCKEDCIVSSTLRLQEPPVCPMCREPW
jgi:hypothetical protein